MDLTLSVSEEAFRDEIRAWLEANNPGREPDRDEEAFDFRVRWQQELHEAGWAGVSWSLTAHTSSSRKKGLPAPCATMLRCTWAGSRVACGTACTTRRLSSGLSGASASCVAAECASQGGRYPGRYVTSSNSGTPASRSTSDASHSSDVGSIQCAFSTARMRAGCRFLLVLLPACME